MNVTSTHHPSPRPGFTHVADAQAKARGPVIVVVSDSPGSVSALRRAAEEAAMHAVRLYVVDSCSSREFKVGLLEESGILGDRDRAVALSILSNPNVELAQIGLAHFDELVDFCNDLGASLLVLDPGCVGGFSGLDGLIGSGLEDVDLTCDVLVVRERATATQ